MKKHLLAGIIMSLSITANAEFVDGNRLLSMLNSDNKEEVALGVGYITGSFDTAIGNFVCPPPNVTVRQVVDITREALSVNPQNRHMSGDVFVVVTTSGLWPCKKNKGSNT